MRVVVVVDAPRPLMIGRQAHFRRYVFRHSLFPIILVAFLLMLPGLASVAFAQAPSNCRVKPLAVTLGTFDPNGQAGLTFAGGSLVGVLTVSPCPETGLISVNTNPQILTQGNPCDSLASPSIVVFPGETQVQFTLPLSIQTVVNIEVIAIFSGGGEQVQGKFFLSPGRISLTALTPTVVGGEQKDPSLTLFTPSAGVAQIVSSNPGVASFGGAPLTNFPVTFNPGVLLQSGFPGPLQVNAVNSLTTATLKAVFRPCTSDFNSATAPTLTGSLDITVQPQPIVHKLSLNIKNLDGTLLKKIGLRLVERFDGATFFELDVGEYVGGSGGAGGNGGGGIQHENHLTLAQQVYKLGQGWALQIVPVQADGTEGQPFSLAETITDASDQSDQGPASSVIFSSATELFQGQVLVHFPLSATGTSHRFFPVHSGNSTLNFDFFSLQNLTLSIPVFISTCAEANSTCTPQLGGAHPEFDTLIMKFADRNGIPPQLLKAQIQQESNFKPNAYRYEALSVDFGQIAAPTRKGSRPFGLIAQRALAPWALAESTDCTPATIFFPQGGSLDLSSPDATARQRYLLMLDQEGIEPQCGVVFHDKFAPTGHILPTDILPSMENVFYTNDGFLVDWSRQSANSVGRTDWRFHQYVTRHPPFTAQTVIAASYGLHQVMYPTAVGEGYVDGRGMGRSPRDLFKPSTSLDLGTEYLAKMFVKSDGSEETNYVDEIDFRFQFAPALRAFNAGERSIDFDIATAKAICVHGPITNNLVYACRVLSHAKNFAPVPLN